MKEYFVKRNEPNKSYLIESTDLIISEKKVTTIRFDRFVKTTQFYDEQYNRSYYGIKICSLDDDGNPKYDDCLFLNKNICRQTDVNLHKAYQVYLETK